MAIRGLNSYCLWFFLTLWRKFDINDLNIIDFRFFSFIMSISGGFGKGLNLKMGGAF